jgi:Zn ribbon nucleic-acid-binding protein
MLKIYDYECPKCGTMDERYIKDDNDIQLCFKCGNQMERKTTFNGTVRGNFADKARTK